MDVKCCKCRKEYDLASNIFEYDKDTNCPILICPYCNFKHAINFMPFENKIEDFKKVKKLDLGNSYLVILGASRIANASRVDQSGTDNARAGYGEAWDISTYTYASKSKSITQDTGPGYIKFSSDGTKMYVCGSQYNAIFQYTLSTAWDLSTAIYANKSKNFNSQDSNANGFAFSSDGTKLYVAGYTNKYIYQYTLSTAWDITTATYAEKSLSIISNAPIPDSVIISSDGTKIYVLNNDGEDKTICQYDLSTDWDVSTGSFTSSLDISGEIEYSIGLFFSSDGSRMFVSDEYPDLIQQYNLSTPWVISTANYASKNLYTGNEDTNLRGIAVSSDGSYIYIVGKQNDTVYQYKLKEGWTKTNDFILATRIYTSKGPIARAYKLKWKISGGTFADIGTTGAITYSAITDLIDGNALLVGEKLCSVQTDYTWQNGLESEGDNLSPDSGTLSLVDEYYTELQWALSCDDAEDEHEYEFELWDVTEGVSIGTCLATITMAAVVAGLSMKWNGVAISKWNGVVINKLNGVD